MSETKPTLKERLTQDVADLIPSPEYFEAEGWFCGFESAVAAKAAEEEANDIWNWRKPQ